ncbi:uncharacterized protein [Castor canadensis]|uniref:Uncharacterized protein n=1 Tax=Castor canadensis TaxID=51338 RepID=A0AC58KTN9_CASCN
MITQYPAVTPRLWAGRRTPERGSPAHLRAEASRDRSPPLGRLRDRGDSGTSAAATRTLRAGSGFPGNFLQPREHAGMGSRGCQDVAIRSITRRRVSRRRSFLLLPSDDFLRHAWICSKAACLPAACGSPPWGLCRPELPGIAGAPTQRTCEPTSFSEGMGSRGCQDVAIRSITRRRVSRRRSFLLLPSDDFLRHAWICSKAACLPAACGSPPWGLCRPELPGIAGAPTQRTCEPTSFSEGMGSRGCQDVAIRSITRRHVSRRRSFLLLPSDDFLRHAWICSKAACLPAACGSPPWGLCRPELPGIAGAPTQRTCEPTSFSEDSEVLPSLTSEKQMVFCCCMTLHVRKAFLTYENG